MQAIIPFHCGAFGAKNMFNIHTKNVWIHNADNLLLNVDMALGTSIAAGSGSGHTQGENGKLKYKSNILVLDFANTYILTFNFCALFGMFSVTIVWFYKTIYI